MTGTDATSNAGPLSPDELEHIDAYWRAANYLSVGQIYLLDNPLLREPLRGRARQAAPARALGHDAGSEPALRPHEPGHPRARPQCALRDRTRPRRPGPGGERLPRGHLQRGVLVDRRGRGRPACAVPAVLVPRRHSEPRRPGDARIDPRGRRARLRAGARLRRRVRQPRSAGAVRRRRRRGRDRAAGRQLALEQVPQPGDRRCRPAGAAPQRLQDRQPHRAGPDPRGRAGRR